MNYNELLAPAAQAMRPSGIRKFFDLATEMPHCISVSYTHLTLPTKLEV